MSQNIQDIELLLENSAFEVRDHFFVNGSVFRITVPVSDLRLEDWDPQLVHEHTLTVSKLYFQQNKIEQGRIVSYLLSSLKEPGEERAHTLINTAYQTGNIDPLLDHLFKEFADADQDGEYIAALGQMNRLLYAFWDGFSKSQVRRIREWCKQTKDRQNSLGEDLYAYSGTRQANTLALINAIYSQTNRILVKEVKQRIEQGYNPQINEDEVRLKQEFSKFGFPEDLSQALDKIDQKFTGSKDAFDFKGCMDLLRSFTERFYRSILDQYGDDGKKVHEQDAEAVAKFFKKKGLLGEDFADMIVSQRHFLSNLASHRLKSREEDARLSRNMIIEMSLYTLRRYQIQ